MTKKRQFLLELFTHSTVPLNARQVYEKAGKILDMATVYRGLKYLESDNKILSFVFDCDERGVERYYCCTRDHHEHYMHCNRCHSFFPIQNCPAAHSFKRIEEETGFKIEQHFITLKGICRNCR